MKTLLGVNYLIASCLCAWKACDDEDAPTGGRWLVATFSFLFWPAFMVAMYFARLISRRGQ